VTYRDFLLTNSEPIRSGSRTGSIRGPDGSGHPPPVTDVGRPASETPISRPAVLRGRTATLARIRDRVVPPPDGDGAVVVVEGRAGYGKSRLLDETAATAARAGVRVGAGTARPGDETVGLAPLLTALFDGPTPLADRGGLGRAHALPEQRYWLVHELGARLARSARRGPMLVCLDDLHRADATTLAALRVLPDRLRGLPIGWLLARRAGAASPPVTTTIDLLAEAGATQLTLDALGEPDVAALVADMVRAEPGPALLALAAGARGRPQLVVELVHGLLEEERVHRVSGRAEVADPALPARVCVATQRRLDGLSPPARRSAEVAAVLGRTFAFDDLAAMVDQSPSAVLAHVDELVRGEVLVDEGGRLAFVDDMVHQVVVEAVPESARRALQRQAAGILLAAGSSPVDVATALAASADPGDRAAVAALHRAATALGPSDPDAAAGLARRALALAVPDDPQRAGLVAETALLLHAAGRAAEGTTLADGALGGGLPPDQEADVRLAVTRMLSLSPDQRAAAGRRALGLPGIGEPRRVGHLAQLVHSLTAAGRAREAAATLAAVEAEVGASGDADAAAVLDVARSGLDYMDGAFLRAQRRLDAAVAGHGRRSLGDGAPATVADLWRSELLAVDDRLDEALQRAADGATRARRGRQVWAARTWEAIRGRHLLQAGRLPAAAEALALALALADGTDALSADVLGAVPTTVVEAAAVVALGRVAIHTVDYALTQRCVDTAAAMVVDGAPEVRRHGSWFLALQAMATGQTAAARAHLVRDEGPCDVVLPRLLVDVADVVHLVRVAIATGDDRLADVALAESAARRRLNPGIASVAAADAHARGLWRRDDRELARAAALFADGPRRLAHASALEDLGCVLVRRGCREEGVGALGSALERYAGASATWDVGRVRRRLRALGVRRRLVRAAAPARGWAGLTASELVVVRLVAHGLTNRAAAARLFLSPHTVSMHLRHAFAKLGVNSRVELTRLVIAHDGADP
jgi:DNA-binding CsgD family transcriptional regulator